MALLNAVNQELADPRLMSAKKARYIPTSVGGKAKQEGEPPDDEGGAHPGAETLEAETGGKPGSAGGEEDVDREAFCSDAHRSMSSSDGDNRFAQACRDAR